MVNIQPASKALKLPHKMIQQSDKQKCIKDKGNRNFLFLSFILVSDIWETEWVLELLSEIKSYFLKLGSAPTGQRSLSGFPLSAGWPWPRTQASFSSGGTLNSVFKCTDTQCTTVFWSQHLLPQTFHTAQDTHQSNGHNKTCCFFCRRLIHLHCFYFFTFLHLEKCLQVLADFSIAYRTVWTYREHI